MAKNFSVLRKKMSSAAQERAHRLAKKYRAEMALDELRAAREMTQQHLARILGVNQAAVSKMEHRADMYISTLQNFVRAMGGQLLISAIFPEGEVKITQFENLGDEQPEDVAAAR
jgi:transcriptional regulator with XRE-family HTH domain